MASAVVVASPAWGRQGSFSMPEAAILSTCMERLRGFLGDTAQHRLVTHARALLTSLNVLESIQDEHKHDSEGEWDEEFLRRAGDLSLKTVSHVCELIEGELELLERVKSACEAAKLELTRSTSGRSESGARRRLARDASNESLGSDISEATRSEAEVLMSRPPLHSSAMWSVPSLVCNSMNDIAMVLLSNGVFTEQIECPKLPRRLSEQSLHRRATSESLQHLTEGKPRQLKKLQTMPFRVPTEEKLSGEIVFANRACRVLLGYRSAEMVKKSYWLFIHKEDRPAFQSALKLITASRHSTCSPEFSVRLQKAVKAGGGYVRFHVCFSRAKPPSRRRTRDEDKSALSCGEFEDRNSLSANTRHMIVMVGRPQASRRPARMSDSVLLSKPTELRPQSQRLPSISLTKIFKEAGMDWKKKHLAGLEVPKPIVKSRSLPSSPCQDTISRGKLIGRAVTSICIPQEGSVNLERRRSGVGVNVLLGSAGSNAPSERSVRSLPVERRQRKAPGRRRGTSSPPSLAKARTVSEEFDSPLTHLYEDEEDQLFSAGKVEKAAKNLEDLHQEELERNSSARLEDTLAALPEETTDEEPPKKESPSGKKMELRINVNNVKPLSPSSMSENTASPVSRSPSGPKPSHLGVRLTRSKRRARSPRPRGGPRSPTEESPTTSFVLQLPSTHSAVESPKDGSLGAGDNKAFPAAVPRPALTSLELNQLEPPLVVMESCMVDSEEESECEEHYDPSVVVELPRGGVVCQTSVGPIQFGIPPETIKDSMLMGLPVPTFYVLPKTMFDRERGINVAEFEFPAYFNFFILQKRVTLITTPRNAQRIKAVFQQALLGPEAVSNDHEFCTNAELRRKPDLNLECGFFTNNPDPDKPGASAAMEVDTLVKFLFFDKEGLVEISETVHVRDEGAEYTLLENNTEVFRTCAFTVALPHISNEHLSSPALDGGTMELQSPLPVFSPVSPPKFRSLARRARMSRRASLPSYPFGMHGQLPVVPLGLDTDKRVCDSSDLRPLRTFNPPLFGVTFLGTSHGFDPQGTTTGFVLWVNRMGCMVDPPPNSSAMLRLYGIAPCLIDAIIVTHCHADHDAGTFHKIVEGHPVTVMSTTVVMASFLTKYSAITGIRPHHLFHLFKYRPVSVGQSVNYNGGKLNFFYSLHSIPCIGFECAFGGKSLVYSSDHMNVPSKIGQLHVQGVMTAGRRDFLLNFPFHHTLVLHEAGVPPIHTPLSTFDAVPMEQKKNLYLVHVSADKVPKETGLRVAAEGVDNTLVIHSEEHRFGQACNVLSLIASIDIFAGLPLTAASELLSICETVECSAFSHILRRFQTDSNYTLYIILSGLVRSEKQKGVQQFQTTGDYFGYKALISSSLKAASSNDHVAMEDCVLLKFDRWNLIQLLKEHEAGRRTLDRLKRRRKFKRCIQLVDQSMKALQRNSVLHDLNFNQKIDLCQCMRQVNKAAGSVLWREGTVQEHCYLVSSGVLEITVNPRLWHERVDLRPSPHPPKFIGRGAFLVDVVALMENALREERRYRAKQLHEDFMGEMLVEEKEENGENGSEEGNSPTDELQAPKPFPGRMLGMLQTSDKFLNGTEKDNEQVWVCPLQLTVREDAVLHVIHGRALNRFFQHSPGLSISFHNCLVRF